MTARLWSIRGLLAAWAVHLGHQPGLGRGFGRGWSSQASHQQLMRHCLQSEGVVRAYIGQSPPRETKHLALCRIGLRRSMPSRAQAQHLPKTQLTFRQDPRHSKQRHEAGSMVRRPALSRPARTGLREPPEPRARAAESRSLLPEPRQDSCCAW